MKQVLTLMAVSLILAGCSSSGPETQSETGIDSVTMRLERGKYLVTIGGCNDCHSPKVMTEKGPVPDVSRLMSGHPSDVTLPASDTATASKWLLFFLDGTAARGPWGTSFAGNLTPDETGIGSWSEEQFANAMRKGWYKGMEGTRMLLPPMPWPNYVGMTDEDIRSIFAYLKSLPPIRNVAPAPIPPGKY